MGQKLTRIRKRGKHKVRLMEIETQTDWSSTMDANLYPIIKTTQTILSSTNDNTNIPALFQIIPVENQNDPFELNHSHKNINIQTIQSLSQIRENKKNDSKPSNSSEKQKSLGTLITKDLSNYFSFEMNCLAEHNRFRRIHKCPPLVLSLRLSNLALTWAQHLSKSKDLSLSGENDYGRNTYITNSVMINGKSTVKKWYREIKNYDFENPGFHPNTERFTQMIWKNSKELGVGFFTKDYTTWIVTYYYPPGNISGEYEANVPLPTLHL